MTKDGRHKFKWMTYRGQRVRIDQDIVPLLTKMWKLGIHTTNSCQASCNFTCKHKRQILKDKDGAEYSAPILTKHCHNSVWLAFESSQDVELLYDIVAEYTDYKVKDAMYHKMSADRFLQTGQTKYHQAPDGWSFSFLLRNRGVRGHWGRPKWGKKRSTVEMWIDDDCKKNKFVIEPQITFPRSHLPYIEARLQLALDKRKKRNVGR